jgi:hypothetical protein
MTISGLLDPPQPDASTIAAASTRDVLRMPDLMSASFKESGKDARDGMRQRAPLGTLGRP